MKAKRVDMEYAIVDIETTGGSVRGSRMTEIAIVIHNGKQVIERWESLIDPQQPIPTAIFALTGITNDLVSGAPVFGDLAQHIYTMLEGRVFVAHNVNFDYSFVKQQLMEEGYNWSARKLCTVRMARQIRPGLASYSLGRLCDALDISISNRHRAGGDADATSILFEKLLRWDTSGVVQTMLMRSSPEQRLPPHLDQADFDRLPDAPGVYYFHDRSGKVIYVGKAVHLKKRVASHFTGHSTQLRRQQFLRDIYHISYEICATELMALLLECVEIKRLWPAHNRALKRFEPKFGLFTYQAQDGYDYLAVGKINKLQPCVQVYQREYDGIQALQTLCREHNIDYGYCRFGSARPKSTQPTAAQDVVSHNTRVAEALNALTQNQPSFYILDRGRRPGEQSCIWIEQGRFYAMGYIDQDHQFNDLADLRQTLQRYPDNHYMMQLIFQFAERHPQKVHDLPGDWPSKVSDVNPSGTVGRLF